MIYLNLFKNILDIIDEPSVEREIENRFIPLCSNLNLVSAIKNVSNNSPVFKEAVSNLTIAAEKASITDFIEEYEKFHNTVMILSDEVALTIKKEADQLKDINISAISGSKLNFVSSRVFVGNSMLLILTSNNKLLDSTLKNFKKPILKTKSITAAPSA